MENDKISGHWRYNVMHDLFFQIAIERFAEAEKAYIEMQKQENDMPNGETYSLRNVITKETLETICFSIMALESFINTISASYISKSFADKIDKHELCIKWVETINRGKKTNFSSEDPLFEKLRATIKNRRSIVHSKSIAVKYTKNGDAIMPQERMLDNYMLPAYNALLAVKELNEWLSVNWSEVRLTFDMSLFSEKIKADFLNVPDTWMFTVVSVMY